MTQILHTVVYAILLAAMLVLSGCANQTSSVGSSPVALAVPEPVTEEVVAEDHIVASSEPVSPAFIVDENLHLHSGSGEPTAGAQTRAIDTSLYLLDIPFNFDRFSLRDDAITFVEVNAVRLQEEQVGPILLEGRTDEIGTLEYNLVLGEQRAHAVKRHLIRLGIKPAGLLTTSYGTVRPLCKEHSADCWQTNRSVRFTTK